MAGMNMAMSALSNFAMGLYGDKAASTDRIFKLTPSAILLNLLAIIRLRYPRLAKSIVAIAPFLVLASAIVALFKNSLSLAWIIGRIQKMFLATITVPDGHPLLDSVKRWMANQGMKRNAREMTLKHDNKLIYGSSLGKDVGKKEQNGKRDLLECQPDGGTYYYRFNGRLFKFDVKQKTHEETSSNGKVVRYRSGFDGLQVSISCVSIFAGPAPVLDFLKHIESLHLADQEFRTKIYRAIFDDIDGWRFDHVPLIRGIEWYLSKETEKLYASLGVPLRRGYLLYGNPGTGKTSFSTAIAGHFRLDLFVINLNTPGLDDNALAALFESFPFHCVVLLEDIDSAGISRESLTQEIKDQNGKKRIKGTVTLSGLLNVLDGPSSKEGRLVIMTTNAPNSLDPALVRPGRIDEKVYLGNACAEVLTAMFKHIFDRPSQERENTSSATHSKHTENLAKSFASEVPSDMLTPAEVQGFLMSRRNNPEQAVAEGRSWATELIETKAQGNNVASQPERSKTEHGTEDGKDAEEDVMHGVELHQEERITSTRPMGVMVPANVPSRKPKVRPRTKNFSISSMRVY